MINGCAAIVTFSFRCLDINAKFAQLSANKRGTTMRVFAIAGAVALGVVAQPAGAAVSYSLNGVSVTGTQQTDVVSTGPCQQCVVTTFTPYASNLFGIMGQPNTTVPGIWTFQGQAGARNIFMATLQWDSAGSLISSSLSGFDEIQRCSTTPCTSILARYSASNFAIQAFDSETGLTSAMAPVPEPGSWALMLVGFMGAGLAMRRRAKPRLALG
jgi:hypothetical protein